MSKGKGKAVPVVGGKLSVPTLGGSGKEAEKVEAEKVEEVVQAVQPEVSSIEVKAEDVVADVVDAAKLAATPAPVVEAPVDLEALMTGRAGFSGHRVRSSNPLFENNVFDFTGSGFPTRFALYPVAVPDTTNEVIRGSQLRVVRAYVEAGYQFVTTDMVSDKPDRVGRAFVPNFEDHDGRVVVNGCFVMYIDKDHVNRKRRDSMSRTRDARDATWDDAGGKLGEGQSIKVEREDMMLDQIMGSRNERGATR